MVKPEPSEQKGGAILITNGRKNNITQVNIPKSSGLGLSVKKNGKRGGQNIVAWGSEVHSNMRGLSGSIEQRCGPVICSVYVEFKTRPVNELSSSKSPDLQRWNDWLAFPNLNVITRNSNGSKSVVTAAFKISDSTMGIWVSFRDEELLPSLTWHMIETASNLSFRLRIYFVAVNDNDKSSEETRNRSHTCRKRYFPFQKNTIDRLPVKYWG